ncbi:hypothetical protein HY642_03020 [Candidatus Woesearchaeota archaeon]|nr:hypothetical protein [Candidatus Woesearchaeota archaeon]
MAALSEHRRGVLVFFIAFFVHVLDALYRLGGASFTLGDNLSITFYLAYLTVAILALFMLDFDNREQGFKTVAFWWAWSSFLPALLLKLSIAVSWLQIPIAIFMFAAPGWILFFLYGYRYSPPVITKFGSLYAFLWALACIAILFPTIKASAGTTLGGVEVQGVPAGVVFKVLYDKVKTGAIDIYESGWRVYNQTGQRLNETFAVARGDYYTGTVDTKAKEDLGVRLENAKATEKQFDPDQDIDVFATLKAQTLDADLNISLNCTVAKQEIPPEAVKLRPKQKFIVETMEDRDIDCIIDRGILTEDGSYSVVLQADFNFRTLSYIRAYFMDKDRLRAFKRQNIDPLTEYGVTDKTPTAIYTRGPLKVGMGLGTSAQPIGLDRAEDETTFTLGVTITNAWQGKILAINRVAVIIPRGFELLDAGGVPFDVSSCSGIGEKQGCDDEISSVYVLKPKLKDVDKEVTLRMPLRVTSADIEQILGLNPLQTHFFKATVDYVYRLEKGVPITIKSSEIEQAGAPKLKTRPKTAVSVNEQGIFAVITYDTDKETIDSLSYKLIDVKPQPFVEVAPTPNYIQEHKWAITGLLRDREYSYQITSTDKDGNKRKTTGRFKATPTTTAPATSAPATPPSTTPTSTAPATSTSPSASST